MNTNRSIPMILVLLASCSRGPGADGSDQEGMQPHFAEALFSQSEIPALRRTVAAISYPVEYDLFMTKTKVLEKRCPAIISRKGTSPWLEVYTLTTMHKLAVRYYEQGGKKVVVSASIVE